MLKSSSSFSRSFYIGALLLPCAALLALSYVVPGKVASSTYVAIWALALGTSIVVMNTWRSAQPTRSLRQAAHDASRADGSAVVTSTTSV